MKSHGSGIISCRCSVAMKRGKSVPIHGSTPQRKECPNCGRMLRVRLVTRPTKQTGHTGITAVKKERRRTRLNAHVSVLETENSELRKKVAELERIVVQAKLCVEEMQDEMSTLREHDEMVTEQKELRDV